jgi:uncharacterized protein YuzE
MAATLAADDIQRLTGLCSILRGLPVRRLNLRYDEEADVLYVKFTDAAGIHDSELTKDDILIEYDANRNIVGLTILEASSR